MLTYIIRRLLYAIPILIGVNVLTALLFFYVNTPDDMARMILGEKNLTPEAVESWKKERGYDLPLFINTKESGLSTITQTVFVQKSAPLLWFDFGKSDRNNIDIGSEIKQRMWPSLAISIPIFISRHTHQPHLLHAPGLLPRNLSRRMGRRLLRNPHERIHALLYYRRPVRTR